MSREDHKLTPILPAPVSLVVLCRSQFPQMGGGLKKKSAGVSDWVTLARGHGDNPPGARAAAHIYSVSW